MKSHKKAFAKSRPHRDGASTRIARDDSLVALPPVNDQLCVGMKMRFVTTNAFGGAFSVTAGNLLDAWLVAGTATTAYQLFDFVRVKRVTIRGMAVPNIAAPDQIASAATVAVEFFGIASNTITGGKQRSNTQIGQTTPAYVSLSPDPRSQAALFQANNTNALFIVRAVDANANPLTGAIIDVDVVYRNSGDVNPAAPGTARTGMTAGNLYFGGLDGANDAATAARSVFVPRV